MIEGGFIIVAVVLVEGGMGKEGKRTSGRRIGKPADWTQKFSGANPARTKIGGNPSSMLLKLKQRRRCSG